VYKAHFKSAGRAGVARKGFAESLRERLEDRAQKISVAIQSGKLTGPDLATAHCGRAETYAQLGRNDDALNDANQAVKLAPNAPEMLACRGFVRFKAGQFDASLADYTSAVTLGATDARTFHTRGLANFYAGRMEAAAADFARAADTNDREAQVYADLWQVWTSQRLNRPVPAAVAQRAATQPRGEWPRPALAMAVNTLPPEEALRAAESKSGDDRVMATTEGYFYLGQYYLGRGDTARAQGYFERTVRQGILIYNENDAAQFELTRMGVAIPPVTSTPSAAATPARAPAPSRVMEDKPRSEETRSSN
jgi:lipoprotein NlpI